MLSSCSCCEYTQDTSTCTDIEHNLVLEIVLVSFNSISISISSNLVLKHLLMDVEVRIASKVIVMLLVIVGKILNKLFLEGNIIEPSG